VYWAGGQAAGLTRCLRRRPRREILSLKTAKVVRRRSHHTQLGDQALGLLDMSEGIPNETGTVDPTDETLALQVKTDAKYFKIGSLPGPVDISGTLRKPTIKPELAALGLRAGVAAGLGRVCHPSAPRSIGLKPCRRMIRLGGGTGNAVH
jgi:hypothetical protein